MAWVVSANVPLATNDVPEWFWTAVDLLKTLQAWTQIGSGDGATYANGSAGPVANAAGLATSGSWVRLQKTISGVVYELMFYSGGPTAGSILVSIDSAFTGGTPSATRRPSATGEYFLLGSGTDAAPSHAYPASGNPATLHFVCNNAAPFGFALWSYDNGTRANNHSLVMDPLANALGTRGAPYVFGSGEYTNATTVKSGFFHHRRRHGLSGAAWVAVRLLVAGDLPGGVGNDPESTSYARGFDLPYYTPGQGCHGYSTLFEMSGTTHSNSHLYSASATGDRIVAGALVVRNWDNSTPT